MFGIPPRAPIFVPAIVKIWGYLPNTMIRFGAADDTKSFTLEAREWNFKKSKWIDSVDGFDYESAISKLKLPPSLYFAGANDAFLGHPQDVELFRNETRATNSKLVVLSKKNGNLHDYGHVDMVTDRDCEKDHFPIALEFLRRNSR